MFGCIIRHYLISKGCEFRHIDDQNAIVHLSKLFKLLNLSFPFQDKKNNHKNKKNQNT